VVPLNTWIFHHSPSLQFAFHLTFLLLPLSACHGMSRVGIPPLPSLKPFPQKLPSALALSAVRRGFMCDLNVTNGDFPPPPPRCFCLANSFLLEVGAAICLKERAVRRSPDRGFPQWPPLPLIPPFFLRTLIVWTPYLFWAWLLPLTDHRSFFYPPEHPTLVPLIKGSSIPSFYSSPMQGSY